MLSPSDEHRVLLGLQERDVVKQAELAEQLHLSAKTLQRLLAKLDTVRSLNHNAAFITLAATPRFDDRGLWTCQGVCFSRHGNLSVTLRFLIDQSHDGQTLEELQDKVQTRVHNQLSLLLHQQAIACFSLARHAVYTSVDRQRGQQQQQARLPLPPGLAAPTSLPVGLDGVSVVRVLVRLLHTPDASIASLAKSLQAQSLSITAKQVRQVIDFYGLKKKDSLNTVGLVQQLRSHYQEQLANMHLPDDLTHRFDRANPSDAHVQKTTRRQVVTLELSRFTAVEVIREPGQQDKAGQPLTALPTLVPKGGRYGYDLIAHVGLQTFIKERTLQDMAEELQPLNIPFSSLYDLQMKFLFYLGHLHRHRAPVLRDYLSRRGSLTWLIDSTLEPGTPLFFGIQDADEDLMLGAWKVATESADVLVPCLKQASEWFGQPERVLHDLSDAMDKACQQAWDDMNHYVCHFHLVRDIGIDLLDKPQAALRDLVRQLQLQSRLKEQRNGQTDWLRQHVEDPTSLAQLLSGGAVTVSPAVLGRQVLMAFHQWLLDYASDGQRQGYPFDPYLLYFHRRVVRASAAVDRLLGDPKVLDQAPVVLTNFARMLRQYLGNPRVSDAARQYEEAFALLRRVRDVLRLSAQGKTPLSDRYLLAATTAATVRPLLEQLRQECRRMSQEAPAAWTRQQHQVVADHLDRYWERLFVEKGPRGERTTNGLEQNWGTIKRKCRKRHGRRKLTRDFQSLPAEVMLVGNLEQARYVELVVGGRHQPVGQAPG